MNDEKQHWETLRKEILYLIEKELSPISQRYGYSEVPLESKIKWKPLVLLLGNDAAGKSTLINEFVGKKIIGTERLLLEDRFTVITGTAESGEHLPGVHPFQDPLYPFAHLQKYGDGLKNHFQLKTLSDCPALSDIAIIDTPGRLEQRLEKERSYDYQGAIGDLAQLADLILIIFDPYKLETLKDYYSHLKSRLPEKAFEDRVVFVLNRIDECSSFENLLLTYGQLCWHLSQVMELRAMPQILLTYSFKQQEALLSEEKPYLSFLNPQRQRLHKMIAEAPKYRLEHMVTFLEHHAGYLRRMLMGVMRFRAFKKSFMLRYHALTAGLGLLGGALLSFFCYETAIFGTSDSRILAASGLFGFIVSLLVSQVLSRRFAMKHFHRYALNHLDQILNGLKLMEGQAYLPQTKELMRSFIQNAVELPSRSRISKDLHKTSMIHTQSGKMS